MDGGGEADLVAIWSPQVSVGRTHDESAVAWLFFTSGTTGRSKGVMITHANVVNVALNFFSDVQSVSQGDALIHVAPVSHGSGIYSIPYWIKGGTQVLPESGGFDEAELFRLLDTHQRASLFAAPTMVQRMVRYANENNVRPTGLRALLVGGAPFYMEDIKAAVQCFGPRIAQVYGQGESPMTISRISAEQIGAAVDGGRYPGPGVRRLHSPHHRSCARPDVTGIATRQGQDGGAGGGDHDPDSGSGAHARVLCGGADRPVGGHHHGLVVCGGLLPPVPRSERAQERLEGGRSALESSARVGQHEERRHVLILTPQAVADPSAQARPTQQDRAGIHLIDRLWMVHTVSVATA